MKKPVGYLLVIPILLFSAFMVLAGVDIQFSSDPQYNDSDVWELVIFLALGAGIFALGRFLHGKFRLSRWSFFSSAIVLTLFTLILAMSWSTMATITGFLLVAVLIAFGLLAPKEYEYEPEHHGFHNPMFAPPRHMHPHMPPPHMHPPHVHPPHMRPPHTHGVGMSAPISFQQVNRLGYLASVTLDEQVKGQITHLHNIGKQILDHVHTNPDDAYKATVFTDVHLPNTTQLLERYTAFTHKPVKTRNMEDAIVNISASIPHMTAVFEHSLDSMYSGVVSDINVNIDILQSLVNMDGLSVE